MRMSVRPATGDTITDRGCAWGWRFATTPDMDAAE